jgi:hypothetical protein
MNTWQCLNQLRYLLRAAVWSGSSTKVFANESVIISASPAPNFLESARCPLVILRPMEGQVDPEFDEEHELMDRKIAATLITAITGDAGLGENAIMGANKTGGQSASEGHGLLEMEECLFTAIRHLQENSGIILQHLAASAAAVQPVELTGGVRYINMAEYTFDLLTTTFRYYPPCTQFDAAGASAGTVNLSWAVPGARYDLLKVILRRASGATPPATPTAGTGVTLASVLATSVTDTPGAGTWSYALFSAYDETNATPTTADRYSDAVTDTAATL